MTEQIKRELRRRSAIEPVIGHLKDDHRMRRNCPDEKRVNMLQDRSLECAPPCLRASDNQFADCALAAALALDSGWPRVPRTQMRVRKPRAASFSSV